MKPGLWRAIALPLILAAAAFVLFGRFVQLDNAAFGLSYTPTSTGVRVNGVDPGSPADRAGIRKGDRIEFVAKTFLGRAEAIYPVPGVRVRVLVDGVRTITLTSGPAKPVQPGADVTFGVVRLAYLLIAALLAWRRPEDRASRALVVFLSTVGFGISLNNHEFGSPIASLLVLQILSTSLLLYSMGAAARFIAIFPSGKAPRVTRLLSGASTLAASIGIAVFVLASLVRTAPLSPAIATEIIYAAFLLSMGFLGATLVERCVHSPANERKRRLWIVLILAVGLAGPAVDLVVQALIGFNHSVDLYASLTLIVIPVGLAYVILRHRVIDVGFVLNRAAVYAVVSIVIVGVFVIVETILGKYVESTSHLTSTTVQLVVALVLGFSVRAIHARADRFVDAVLFRERHAAEAAIRTFAHDAAYITDGEVLGARCIETVLRWGGAASAGIWLRNEANFYEPRHSTFAQSPAVDENDPAMVAMRARRAVADLSGSGSALPGVLAFPMAVRGELLGALVCGSKNADETYAPDERAALETLAGAVGHAFDALEVRELRRRLEALGGTEGLNAAGLATGGALGTF